MSGVRPALIVAVALVLGVVAASVVLWSSTDPSRGSRLEGGPGAGACVAPAGAEQQDVDPDDSPEARWPRDPGERVVVHFAVGGLTSRYADLVGEAAAIWARSPCVEPVVVDTCPADSHCSTVVTRKRGEDRDTDGDSESDDRRGVRRSNTITLYTALLDKSSDNGVLATIVHEMGHALGLMHRNDPDSVMNAETGDSTDPVPDAIDFANLVAVYG